MIMVATSDLPIYISHTRMMNVASSYFPFPKVSHHGLAKLLDFWIQCKQLKKINSLQIQVMVHNYNTSSMCPENNSMAPLSLTIASHAVMCSKCVLNSYTDLHQQLCTFLSVYTLVLPCNNTRCNFQFSCFWI